MDNPLSVSVLALDPVLDAGAKSSLYGSPEITMVLPHEPAKVAVVVADRVDGQVLELVRTTRSAAYGPEVVLVATELAPDEARRAIALGARGLLRRREASADRLVRTVTTAADGDCTLPTDLLGLLLADPLGLPGEPSGRFGPAAPRAWAGPGLTAREAAVLRLVAEGRETSEIAEELCYSVRTVTAVVRDITQRYRLRNRAHAVAYAMRGGLL
ncbi:helix-turn-helix transcriptional regulator [Streptomyces tateyamensis]|uniref:Helix-turn-helix transcriptional regulator n=1 Tax=Streptomyces tateyamensis TaxID=565073 RepID=A0A2V4NUP8_9ACTN|nr:LuxR C-terminal-related transcriptional regulator [Streptomyces tateyamensis]PYC87472.1 helix-turn-helix transcriptional regulator [Streptomyces tateyamensis]